MDEVNVDASVARLDRLIRPRFASVPLEREDVIALLIHAEILARAYQRSMEHQLFPSASAPSPLAAAVLALVARAEERGEEEWA